MTEEQRQGIMNLPASELPAIEEEKDFRSTIGWRIFRIMSEFIEGFQFLADFEKTVTFFGSARLKEDSKWYQEAQSLGRKLADEDYGVITGGGPGIMEAGNRGALDSKKGSSIGLNIQLPNEQRINPYVKKSQAFHYFFSRKVMLSYSAQAYVYFPGGFGTLDEFFELVTLIQTKKIPVKIPIILIGKEFWTPLLNWIETDLVNKFKTATPHDLKLYTVVDSADEAFELVLKAPRRENF